MYINPDFCCELSILSLKVFNYNRFFKKYMKSETAINQLFSFFPTLTIIPIP